MIAGIEMDYNMDCWKRDSLNVFQMFKAGSEIFEILKKCCYSTNALQELAFYQLVCLSSFYSII